MRHFHRLGILVVCLLGEPSTAFGSPLVYTPDELRAVLAPRLSVAELDRLEIPFQADEDIRELASEVTRLAHNDRQKLSSLLSYFRGQGYLDRYDQAGTYTARRTLQEGKGNCLSFANLFVAMARSVGLRAVYLDASDVHSDFSRAGSVLVSYGHILVGIRTGPDIVTIDFDGKLKDFKRYEILSDIEATAEFYSNLGYELSWQRRDAGGFASPDALEAFRLATRIAPGYARAWNNLGVALGRSGQFDEAVRAYQTAIRSKGDLAAPHANLGQVHLRRGNLEAAVAALQRAVRLQPNNEHYRYFLGRALALDGRTEAALEQLEAGVRLNGELFQLHLQLAQVHVEMKNWDRAKASARRVLELVPGHREAKRILRCLALSPGKSCG